MVTGLDRDDSAAERASRAGAESVVVGDLSDSGALHRAVAESDAVIHTAANVREWGSMRDFIEVNVEGTANLLAAAPDSARVVHLSSVVVYGYDNPGTQDESASMRASGIPYLDTKAASDRMARESGAVVIRPGDVYGPGSVPWVERPLDLMRKRLLAVPKESRMLPVYVDDLVEAILLGIDRGEPGEAYAVWSGEEVTFAGYFDLLADQAGVPRPARLPAPALWMLGGLAEAAARLTRSEPAIGRFGATFISRAGSVSNRRAREELGWEPRVSLEEGVCRSVG